MYSFGIINQLDESFNRQNGDDRLKFTATLLSQCLSTRQWKMNHIAWYSFDPGKLVVTLVVQCYGVTVPGTSVFFACNIGLLVVIYPWLIMV